MAECLTAGALCFIRFSYFNLFCEFMMTTPWQSDNAFISQSVWFWLGYTQKGFFRNKDICTLLIKMYVAICLNTKPLHLTSLHFTLWYYRDLKLSQVSRCTASEYLKLRVFSIFKYFAFAISQTIERFIISCFNIKSFDFIQSLMCIEERYRLCSKYCVEH